MGVDMIILKIIGLLIVLWLGSAFLHGVYLGFKEDVKDFEPDKTKLMSFHSSKYFCIKCQWHGISRQLAGASCPRCLSDIAEHDEDGYHCLSDGRLTHKRMRELHGYK